MIVKIDEAAECCHDSCPSDLVPRTEQRQQTKAIVPRYALRLLDALGGNCPTSPVQVSTCTCGE